MLFAGAPFPFKIVFGIDDALRPAALAGFPATDAAAIAIVNRSANWFLFTGDLLVWDESPV